MDAEYRSKEVGSKGKPGKGVRGWHQRVDRRDNKGGGGQLKKTKTKGRDLKQQNTDDEKIGAMEGWRKYRYERGEIQKTSRNNNHQRNESSNARELVIRSRNGLMAAKLLKVIGGSQRLLDHREGKKG